MSSVPTGEANRFRLDLDSYQLLEGDSPVRLERQPMELLILLVQRRGQLVTRDEIANRLWGDGVFVDTDRNINTIVRKLRLALKDDPDHPEFLETVVGKGYRFVGRLSVTSSQTEPKPQQSAEAVPGGKPRGQIRARWVVASLTGLAITAGIWSGWRRLQNREDHGMVHSLAVLPLDNISGDKSQDYFADGMTQELTTELAQVGDLRVISHTSVLQYKDARQSLRQIAKDLHVDAVIEGSVERSGNRVRVAARLIRAPSDQTMWANSYERDLRDVLGLQRDIAQDIAEHVKVKLTGAGETSGKPRILNPEAHDLYLQGLFHYEKNTEADLREAISDFKKAVAIEPNYAAPYAGLADAYAELGIFYWPPPEAMPQAKAAALKALQLDPDFSEAHVSLGSVYYFYEWDWTAAEQEAEKAIALNANNPYAHDLLGGYYGTVGRFSESAAEIRRASEIAPRSAEILGDTVFWTFMARNYDLAITNGLAVTALEPDNAFAQVFLGMAYAELGNNTEAIRRADLAYQSDRGPLVASFRANVYALAGRKREAAEALREVEKQRAEQYSCAYEVGTAYIVLGQTGRGFQWLDNAYRGRSECMILLKVDPRLDSVRSDRRYQELLRQVGLAE